MVHVADLPQATSASTTGSDSGVSKEFLELSTEATQPFNEVTEEELGNSEFYEDEYFEDYAN